MVFFKLDPRKTRKSPHFWQTIANGQCFTHIFEEKKFTRAKLVPIVTNYTSGFNMKGRSHSSIFAVQTWAKSRTLSFRPLPQVAEQDDQEPHCSQVRTTGDQILDFYIWWDQERLREQRKITEPWCFPLRDLLDTFQVVKRRYYPGSEKYGYCPSGENVDTSQVVKKLLTTHLGSFQSCKSWSEESEPQEMEF